MASTAFALAGFAGWQIILTFALAGYRTSLVLSGRKAANAFVTDGSDVPGFGQRLTRARDNCFENLVPFVALVVVATLVGRVALLDPLAPWLLCARLGQSVVHLMSTSVLAVQVRFAFYLVQIGIMGWWAFRLVAG
jgi:uncharacterized MAPEG superfamily protein